MSNILRKAAVLAKTGASGSTLRRWIKSEGFPEPLRLGPRLAGWPEDEVDRWIAARPRGALGAEVAKPLADHRERTAKATR